MSFSFQDLKNALVSLSNEELNALSATITELLEDRQKVLWGNVIAAAKKYEQHFGPIQIYGELDTHGRNAVLEDLLETPGSIYYYDTCR